VSLGLKHGPYGRNNPKSKINKMREEKKNINREKE
jgi:hypothetical protein